MFEQLSNSRLLFRSQLSLGTTGLIGSPETAFVMRADFDLQVVQHSPHVLITAAWECKMPRVVLSATDDARFTPGRKTHRLGFVELSILKCCQSYQAVA